MSGITRRLPRLIGFDLDGTVWYPDMYMLWGGGAPFQAVEKAQELLDKNGNSVKLLGIIPSLFDELMSDEKWKDTKVAWVSCTDEPRWARECLQKFLTVEGHKIEDVAHSSQIFVDNKQVHFRNLKAEYPDIAFDEMLFFDNEMNNIRNVSKLGVKCVYCPDGVNRKAWEEGLAMFR